MKITRSLLALLPTALITCACFWPASAHAQSSLLLAPASGWNGIFLTSAVEAGFQERGDPSVKVSMISMNSASVIPGTVGPGSVIMVPPTFASQLPDSGLLKDLSTATLLASFVVGTATTPDTFTFDINTETSAQNAMVDFGGGLKPADAFVNIRFRLSTFAPITNPGAAIRLPDMPMLTEPASETMQALVDAIIGGTPVSGVLNPGDPGITLPLTLTDLGDRFAYQLDYRIVTPFGSDPQTSYSFTGSTQVPEPATNVLCLGALAFAGLRRRRTATFPHRK